MQSSIVEPLLLFCAHAIRWHDGRCCGVVLRVFRSIIPEFQVIQPPTPESIPSTNNPTEQSTSSSSRPLDEFPIPQATGSAIREYISSDVLKACITSLHEPYFVDLQKELGHVIASILMFYSPATQTPREVLYSLPNIKQQDVDSTIEYVCRPGSHSRQQRALVLDLLKDLKGVSISEMGKLSKSVGIKPDSSRSVKKTTRSKMAQEFMTAPAPSGAPGGGTNQAGGRRDSPDLEGVAGLFNA